MAASDESNYSANEDGNPNFAAKAQQRLLQLKKGRNERIDAVVQESATEMDRLRTSIAKLQQDRRTKEVQVVAASIMRIIEALEHRKNIERRMETLICRLAHRTRDIERMMKIGLQGREEDMKKAK
ncbi:t-complex 1 [Fusarium beomiforme]|uniref:T-complex 1 n=1 Tax=Fusarium beomiforme TaxID=44412 RepID=A0A9P5DVJ7_9HYPO|nr:t-complex 1 [Fusarium beomiforme]